MEIYKEALVLIASPAIGRIRVPQDLSGKNIFMWPEGCPYRKSLEGWLSEHRISSTITNIASYGTILGCVSSGAGVSLVPKGVFDRFKKMGGISGYTFGDLMPIQNYFIWSRNAGSYRARDTFAELIKDEFKDA